MHALSRRFVVQLALGLAGALSALGAGAAANASSPVDGFIVRLREAPPHAPAARVSSALSLAQAQTRQRLGQVLSASGLAAQRGWRVQTAGRASHLLLAPQALSASEAALWQARLASRPEVAWVEPNVREPRLQADLPVPDDPLFAGTAGQWWLHPVGGSNGNALESRLRGVPGFQTAWALGTGASSVVVAVLDTGLTAHPDLPGSRLLPGYDMVSDAAAARDGDGRDSQPQDPGDAVSDADKAADATRLANCSTTDSSWHGTTVTGLIGARSGDAWGGAGADWAVRILPVRVAGQCGATVRDIVDGMRWAAGLAVCKQWADSSDTSAGCLQWAPTNPHPARVINLSFGGSAACGSEYQAAVDELWALGVVVVAPAGNQHSAPSRPANCQQVVGVAALNRDGFKANYSNFGALTIATVGGDDSGGRWGALLADSGLLAPHNAGADAPGDPSHGAHYGSSFAAPLVSATLSLMLAAHPGLTPAQLVAGLKASARPHVKSPWMASCSADNPGRCLCTRSQCGAGMLDTEQAVRYAVAHAQGQRYQAPQWPQVWIDTSELAEAASLGQDREPIASTSGEGSSTGGGGLSALAVAALGLAWLGLPRRRRRS